MLLPTIEHPGYQDGHWWWHQCPESPCRPGDAISSGPEVQLPTAQSTLSLLCHLPAAWPCTNKLGISDSQSTQLSNSEVALEKRQQVPDAHALPFPTSPHSIPLSQDTTSEFSQDHPPSTKHSVPIKANQHSRWKLSPIPELHHPLFSWDLEQCSA